MKSKALTIITAAVLLSGSAALYAMSAGVGASDEVTGEAGLPARPAAPPAFSVVVTSHRAASGHSRSGARSNPGVRSTGWQVAPTTGYGWDEVPPDPRS